MPSPRPTVPPYLLMLVVSLALVGLIGYQTVKDHKNSGDLLLENTTLKELLKEERKKATDLHKKFAKLWTQKDVLNGLKEGLSGQLIELDRVKSLTEAGKKKLESSLIEKEIEIKDLKEEIKLLKKEIVQKDTEISDLNARFKEMGKHSSGSLDNESINGSESAVKEDDKKHEKKELSEENGTSSGKLFAEREKDFSDHNKEIESAKLSIEHTNEHAGESKKKSDMQSMDNEDTESKVDGREEAVAEADADKRHDEEETEKIQQEDTQKIHQEADADKTLEEEETEKIREEEETEKIHEEETEEHPDVDLDVLNKTDLEENETAAME